MFNILLCGSAENAKQRLLKAINTKFKKKRIIVPNKRERVEQCFNGTQNLHDNEILEIFQDTIREQCRDEEKIKTGFLSDYTVIDSIAQVWGLLGQPKAENLITMPEVEESVHRYQASLVLFLEPPPSSYSNEEEREESEAVSNRYRFLFHRLHIAYFELRNPDPEMMMKQVEHAIRTGCIPLETTRLQRYQRGVEVAEHISKTSNFAFFLSLPGSSQQSNSDTRRVHVKTIVITEYESKQTWTSYDRGETNRFINRYGTDNLALMSFHINVKAEDVHTMLKSGITINGSQYSFLGCSSSGLKERKCYLWKGSSFEAEQKLSECGEFKEIVSIPKRMARIGLLFSGVRLTGITVAEEQTIKTKDIERNGKCFTDGCGAIGTALARKVFSELRGETLVYDRNNGDRGYLPSVYQVRLQGYKGVLALDPSLDPNSIKVRYSMKKFQTSCFPSLGVCDYSRPHTFGNLNKQFIMLLSGLGVPDDVFLSKQADHFKNIMSMRQDPEKAIRILQWQNEFDIAQKIIDMSQDPMRQEYSEEVKKCIASVQMKLMSKFQKVNKRATKDEDKDEINAGKLAILIPNSRTIFGVCDPTGTLKYGECFIRLTLGNIQQPDTITGQVIVCKNPCYLLGDIRVLTAVDRPGNAMLKSLVDCIVFPVTGIRPHCDEIAGSDLDGDQYFVSWDKDLIPPRVHDPYTYPSETGPSRVRDPIIYFSQQNKVHKLTGKVDSLYQKWASLKGVSSDKCQELGMLFSRVIDSCKSGEQIVVPRHLTDNSTNRKDREYVWEKLMEQATKYLNQFKEKVVKMQQGYDISTCTQEFVQEIVEEELTNISEFAKFKFALAHVGSIDILLDLYGRSINFAFFSKTEKMEAFLLGVDKKLLENALNKSDLLLQNELAFFKMETSHHQWCYFFEASHDQFQWEHLLRALTQHNKTFIVFGIPDAIVIVLQFLTQCQLGVEQNVAAGTVTSYLYSRRFGYIRKYVLGTGYSLDLTTNTLQLYRDNVKNRSFVWLNASDCKKTQGRHTDKELFNENVNAISVDLQRFGDMRDQLQPHPLVNKIPIQQIEVYAHNELQGVPYFDTVEANDELPVPQIQDTNQEEEISDDIELIAENMLQCESDYRFQTDCDMLEALKTSAEGARPLAFKMILESWREINGDLPNEIDRLICLLLRRVVLSFPPLLVPDTVQDIIISCVRNTPNTCPKELLETLGLLTRLGSPDRAQSLCENMVEIFMTRQKFLEILKMWSAWWALDRDTAFKFLSCVRLLNEDNSTDESSDETMIDIKQIDKYIHHFGTLQVLELLHESGTVKESMRNKNENSVSSLSGLKAAKVQQVEDDTLTFHCSQALPGHCKIMNGQFVALARQHDLKRGLDHRAYTCFGQILSVRKAPISIIVKIDGGIPLQLEQNINPADEKSCFWKMNLLPNIVSHTRIAEALSRLVPLDDEKKMNHSPSQELLKILCHPGAHPEGSPLSKKIEFDLENNSSGIRVEEGYTTLQGLNSRQQEAVISAIEKKVSLIQGPPGTGKTTVACHIIRTIYTMKEDYKILVVAETNIAVDNIVKKLMKYEELQILRVGNDGEIDFEVKNRGQTTEGHLRQMEETERKKTVFRDRQGIERKKPKLVQELLRKQRIILTTCSGAGSPDLQSIMFDFVLLDESTQTKETTLLCSLTHGAKQLVLIGDPEQLGPVTAQDDFACAGLPDLQNLSLTLFHRLYKSLNQRCVFLNTQHRMHSSLMKFPSNEFYEGKLVSGVTDAKIGLVIFPWPKKDERLCFINVEGREERLGTSFFNMSEVQMVKKVVDAILNIEEHDCIHRLDITQIGVITLYKGQISKISSSICSGIQVSTIDGFQGRENELIIVSTVRSNEGGSLGFVDNKRRINVLLTRAKRGLIVIGNEATLKHSETWMRWLREAPRLAPEDVKIGSSRKNGGNQERCGRSNRGQGNDAHQGRGRGRSSWNHGQNRNGGRGSSGIGREGHSGQSRGKNWDNSARSRGLGRATGGEEETG